MVMGLSAFLQMKLDQVSSLNGNGGKGAPMQTASLPRGSIAHSNSQSVAGSAKSLLDAADRRIKGLVAADERMKRRLSEAHQEKVTWLSVLVQFLDFLNLSRMSFCG